MQLHRTHRVQLNWHIAEDEVMNKSCFVLNQSLFGNHDGYQLSKENLSKIKQNRSITHFIDTFDPLSQY